MNFTIYLKYLLYVFIRVYVLGMDMLYEGMKVT
jgi:hypothetical protein